MLGNQPTSEFATVADRLIIALGGGAILREESH